HRAQQQAAAPCPAGNCRGARATVMGRTARPDVAFDAPFALTRREKVFTLVGVLLGLLLAALDQTIVASAGPAIQRDLNVSAAEYPWITTAYMIASTVTVPIYGKL